MKKIIAFSGLSLLLLICITAAFTGCSTSSDPNPSPSDAREKFTGHWNVNETWTKLTYEVNISLDGSSSTHVLISNFGGTGSTARALVSGNNITLDPADQVIGDGITVNGSGSITGTTKINWAYTLNDGATLINAIAVYSK
jgi:hypothetical protein